MSFLNWLFQMGRRETFTAPSLQSVLEQKICMDAFDVKDQDSYFDSSESAELRWHLRRFSADVIPVKMVLVKLRMLTHLHPLVDVWDYIVSVSI